MIKKLPDGWEIKKLGEVCDVIAGQSPEGKFYNANGDGLPFYQGKKEYGEKYIGVPTTWTTKITKEAIENDILISVRAPVGPINFATQKICIGRGLAAIRSSKLIDKEFLYNFLLKHENEIVGNSGAVFNSINKMQIEAIEIPLPPLQEQKRISDILGKAFAGIKIAKENAEKNLKNSREFFNSFLNDIFANPGEGWEVKKLGEICSYLSRGISPKYIDQGGVCVLNQKCVRNHIVSKDQARRHDLKVKPVISERFIQFGDVLVNSTGTGTLGRVAQVRNIPIEPTTVDSHVTIVRPKPGKFFLNFFGYMLVFIEEQIKQAGEGCGGQTELSRTVLANNFLVSYPTSVIDQKNIVVILDEVLLKTKQLENIYQQKLTALDELKKSILEKAFCGELKRKTYQKSFSEELKEASL
jgi:type I restriction enzyme S subunit